MGPGQLQMVEEVAVIMVDEHDCGGLWSLVEPRIEEGVRAVVLDFSEVEYLNSMNIAAIISLRSKLTNRDARLALCCMRDQIASIFRVLKLERLFDLGLDREAALRAVKAA